MREPGRRPSRPRPAVRWGVPLGAAALLGVGGAFLLHAQVTAGSPTALPELHGEATWPPGARPAPPLETHGRAAVVAFLGRGCASCRTVLSRVLNRLPSADRPVLVVAPATKAAAFGVAPGRPLLVLVDRHGDERTGYAFPLAPAFLERDLRTLAADS